MEIKRNGSQPSTQGAAENFTGGVRIDPMFRSSAPGQFAVALVTFEPGAAHGLAHALIGTNLDRDDWSWLDAIRGRTEGRDSTWRNRYLPCQQRHWQIAFPRPFQRVDFLAARYQEQSSQLTV